MLSFLFAMLPVLAPQGPSLAPVVINEISHDDSGTIDDRDFVELWNRTLAPIDLSNWTLQGEEGTLGGNPNGAFIIPVGTILGPGQYLVIGHTAVPNVTLVSTPTNPAEWLGENVAGSANAPDGVTLRDNVGNIVDSVVWNYAAWTAAVPPWLEGSGLWGSMQMLDSGSVPPQFWMTAQRWQDGYDSNDNGADFVYMPWTPGAANGSLNTLLPPQTADCDGPVGSDLSSLFHFSFVPVTIQDPAAVTVATGSVRVFPPSPQGGNVARIQDPTGGGNIVAAAALPLLDSFVFECWTYVVPGNPALLAGEGESWAIGVRGTTDAFGHPVDAPGTYYTQASLCASRAPGATGVAWMAYVSATQTDLYLVDANNGGPGFTVLAGPITANATQNSGWQRLRLRIDGTSLVANFGGTFGADDGQRFTATVAAGHGAPWLQYRECILGNSNMTGLLVDRIEMYTPVTGTVTFAGTGSPTSIGVPAIGTAGQPQLGSSNFQITATSLIPFGVSLVALDANPLLPGVPVPGASPALRLYATPTVVATTLNSPLGLATLTFPLPPVNALAGVVLSAQYFDLDVALPYALPFGSSRGCQIIVGN